MGWMELMVIGVVALIVVGPKDLPVMFQALGKMTAKVRRMAREFSGAMNDAANASGMADISKDLKGAVSPSSLGVDKLKDAADAFDKWEPGKTKPVMGSETAKLAAERAEQARKIREKTAEVAQARIDREKAEAAAAEAKPAEAPKAKTAAKSAAKPATTTAKTTRAKTTKAKSGTAKADTAKAGTAKPAAKTTKKPAAKKPAAKKPAAPKKAAKTPPKAKPDEAKDA